MAMIPWWIHYPNVNNEIINLDWLLQVTNENSLKIENFIGVNTIKYADPILWDITKQYEANTIVVDPYTGDAYISTEAVPYGVALSNESYWTRIYNYASEIHTFRDQIAADEQLSTTATAPRVVNDLVFLNGLLYRVTAPMIAGDSYVVDSNCVKTTINAELLRLHTSIGAEAQAREDADTALGGRIDNEAEARADADTALGGRIDNEAQARADADTALGGRIDDEVEARADADTALGHRIDDEAEARADAIADEIAAREASETNIVNALISNNKSLNKRVLIISDSYGSATGVSTDEVFVNILKNNGFNIEDFSTPGGGFTVAGSPNGTFLDVLNNNILTSPELVTDVMVLGGLNDSVLGNLNSVESAIATFIARCKSLYTNANIHIGYIGNMHTTFTINANIIGGIAAYQKCGKYGASYVNNCEYILRGNYLLADKTHPSVAGHIELANFIGNYILNGNIDIVRAIKPSTVSSVLYMNERMSNNVITLFNSAKNAFTNLSETNTWDGTHYIELGDMGYNYLYGDPVSNSDPLSAITWCVAGNTNIDGVLYPSSLQFTISDNKLYCAPLVLKSDGYVTGVLSQIHIPLFSVTIDALSS